MKTGIFNFLTKCVLITLFLSPFATAKAQGGGDFWSHLRFGGMAGAAFSNNYTDVTVAPSVLYQANEYVGVGVGLQGTYVEYDHFYESYIYGASLIGILSPIPEVQLSAELEQLRVNFDYNERLGTSIINGYEVSNDRNFWNTALFLGAGYSSRNLTIGLRYNVLFRERDFVYSDALMPFVRVYF
ncbi:MAG: hypothetical protein BM557_10755 [Flavobacterium sp. MedPE-SWcel]|uniref:hypothetical protein n=1 Tax=uncultured Flavobacterium sp. TaxID=165435 RepID=UPI00091EEBF2|nr:hypothetical protein [uncultured Flavobacterium sp.]OIQ16027.1 MAG: hypothetical protein BM557_10755 [Flavobacterium sp. MedPE-SWcel]